LVFSSLPQEFAAGFLRRLGLASSGPEKDAALVRAFWTSLEESKAPYEQTLFDWHGGLRSTARAQQSPSASVYAHPAFGAARTALEGFEPLPEARLDHPYFARRTPCTMLIDEVEALWAPIAQSDDWSAFAAKLSDIGTMAEAYATSTASP
jgi:serine/tyrosine/threonine adenylyltransferase